ncbi:retrovirus-related pol polyprotein from transposon TNT 1-94 [Tanacetum coccineum]
MESAPSSLHNIYSFYEREPSETRSEEMVEVDINTLTMEQYMALTIGNNGNNVNFEIKGQFIKELRYNTFTDTKGEDAYEHMQRSKRWEDKIPAGQSIHRTFSTKHLFKSIVLHRKLPRNWKRSLISSKIWMKHCIMLGKDVGDHSQKWHDRATTRQRCSDSSDDIVAIINKLDNLGCDVKKLKENVHAIQVGCKIYEGIDKTKECPLNDEEIRVEEEQREEEQESTVRFNARCSAVLQNQLPAKEKDLGSFILPCLIGSLNASDALDDLGASIRVMPFFMFKRLGLVNLKPVNMLIEMEDKSMQASKGIVEDVLVKIDKFIFLVDFVILDKVEDDKVTIILGQSMLATALA